MRKSLSLEAAVLVLAIGGCGAPANQSQAIRSNGAPQAQPIAYFEGTIDVANNTIEVHSVPPPGSSEAGVHRSGITLPYGTGPNEVHFHTCPGTVAYSVATHQLTGTVQAVNNLPVQVQMLNAVIDSVSPADVTPASGSIANYGTVNPGVGADCSANTLTWTFTDPTDANLTFRGHADGTPVGACPGAVPVCDLQPEGGTVNLVCPPGLTIGTITYASYGTPSGACPGPFANGSCHATTSQSVADTSCLGLPSCSISATNGVFGDPCVGTFKALAVTANCCPL